LLRKYLKFCDAAYVGFPSLSAAQANDAGYKAMADSIDLSVLGVKK
jgi:hypothetical protein